MRISSIIRVGGAVAVLFAGGLGCGGGESSGTGAGGKGGSSTPGDGGRGGSGGSTGGSGVGGSAGSNSNGSGGTSSGGGPGTGGTSPGTGGGSLAAPGAREPQPDHPEAAEKEEAAARQPVLEARVGAAAPPAKPAGAEARAVERAAAARPVAPVPAARWAATTARGRRWGGPPGTASPPRSTTPSSRGKRTPWRRAASRTPVINTSTSTRAGGRERATAPATSPSTRRRTGREVCRPSRPTSMGSVSRPGSTRTPAKMDAATTTRHLLPAGRGRRMAPPSRAN